MQRFAAEDLKNVYSPFHVPRGQVEPGETFEVETEDGFGGRLRRPEDLTPETLEWVEENLCPVTGPIAVSGARPGDVVDVRIQAIEVTTPGIVILSKYQAPSPDDWFLPTEYDRLKTYPVEGGELIFNDRLRLPVRPLIGCLASAPKQEVILSRREGDFGGNQDCNVMTAGSTVTLPVNVAGGLLYFGDCKVIMADAEIVNAPECGTLITATVDVRRRPKSMHWPRVTTDDQIFTVVSDISAADACRQAFREMLLWLEEDTGASRQDVAMLMGMVAHVSMCQVSNTFHTARCGMPTEYIRSLEA